MRALAGHLVTIALLVSSLSACGGDDAGDPLAPDDPEAPQAADTTTPTGLALPVAVGQIIEGAIVNPFGVVRSSLDRADTGHSGIDLVLATGAPLFAVADGVIISVAAATDGFPGQLVRILIGSDAGTGEGWMFLYEHVQLTQGLGVGSTVLRGQQIAENPLDGASRSNHLELFWGFNDFQFNRDQSCWVDQLGSEQRAELLDRFNKVLRVHHDFISVWRAVDFNEGMLPFKELLDVSRFPSGALMCYPKGNRRQGAGLRRIAASSSWLSTRHRSRGLSPAHRAN